MGIILLFIVSAVTPMVLGYNARTTEEQIVEDYAFDRYDKYYFPEGYSPEKSILSVHLMMLNQNYQLVLKR